MPVYVAGVLIGLVSGLRAFTGIAAVSWAAHLGWIHLEGTKLAFLDLAATPWILTLLAFGELVGDKLPQTPNRTMPMAFAARIGIGALCGAALGMTNGPLVGAILAGVVGAITGTLGGLRVRLRLASAFGKDLPAAIVEDVFAIGVALFVVSR